MDRIDDNIRSSYTFGRKIKRIDQAFENVRDYTMGKTDHHTPKTLIADAKIKKHYDIESYKTMLKNSQKIIQECVTKHGALGVTAIVKALIESI